MSRSSLFRLLLTLTSRGDRARLVAFVGLAAVERLAVVAAAFGFARQATLATICAGAVAVALALVRRALAATTTRRVRAGLATTLVRCLLASDLPFDAPCEDDDALSTAVAGLHDAPQFVAGQAPALAADSMAALVIAPFLAWRLAPRSLAVAAVAMGLASVLVAAALRLTARWSAAAQKSFAVVYDDLAAAVGGRLEIAASGRAERFQKEVAKHLADWQREEARGSFRMALATRLPLVAAAAVAGLAIWLDGTAEGLLARDALGQGLVVASTAPTFVGALRGAFDWVRSRETLRPLLSLLGSGVGWRSRSASPERTESVPSPLGPIEWQDISFAYSSVGRRRRLVLRDLTGEWRPGTALAVQGPNGSGKSTLLRLLLGIGRPASGRILVGGVDLSTLDVQAWRRSVAYLPQRPFVPERATVREAVRFIAEGATDAAICEALERVELWPVLASDGSDDPLATRVLTLSAGQRQRLALARVLCQETSIVLLDEPDANLDPEGVRCVARLVRHLAVTGRVAFAAHTRELLEIADTIVHLSSSRG